MSTIVKNMNDMNANPGTDAGPRCTSAGEPETNQHPKADGFCCKDERLLLKSMSIPSLLEIQFYLKWTCQSNWNIRSLRISYWKNNTFLDISIHFNPEMSEAPTCTLGNPDTCGLGWLRTMKPHGKNASFYRGKLTDIWRPQKMGWQCGFLQCINNRTTPYTSPFLSSLCFLSSYISYILIPTLLADGVCQEYVCWLGNLHKSQAPSQSPR